ncbi:MAG: SUMF1/EgtB/PvdO family nonheme iron enzyme [Chloracidobacterium sp.]|nr:SUMF1/EgtB/PvdO family nonheme iron enzyme [Chloracidobacterium sp.]MDW8216038.1 SUMF1/EgtB/PvdO family nonheme iron enzyme [Acidobacteriota bacterium]
MRKVAYGIEVVYIPAGAFCMGSPVGEAGRGDDEFQHRVRITKPFWLGKYEVTQAQWAAVMGNNPSEFEDCPACPERR